MSTDGSRSGQDETAVSAAVMPYISKYIAWSQILKARRDADLEMNRAQEQAEYADIAKACFTSHWVQGAREAFVLFGLDQKCTEAIECIEFPSPQTAFVFTHDPGPPDERWRYEVIIENGEWRIARKFQIEFNGRPWDQEEIL